MSRERKIIEHLHDGDCPKCGFPETIYVRDEKTFQLLEEKCGKCDWAEKIISENKHYHTRHTRR